MILENYQNFHDYGLPYNLTNTEDNPSNLTQAERMMKNIEYLYKKMTLCTRYVTYFDLYKFTTVITEPTKFQTEINNLEPYTSAIINTSINTETGQVYSPGDIVIKNNDGSTNIIQAQRGGIFYPSEIKKEDGENNYTYNFTFAYKSAAPSSQKETATHSGDTWTGKYATQMVFEQLAGNTVGSPYNYVYEEWNDAFSDTFTAATTVTTNLPIPPIVHCYAGSEEIYADQTVAYTAGSGEEKGSYTVNISIKNNLCSKVVIK